VICSLDTTSKRLIDDLAAVSGETLHESEYTHIHLADISNSVDLLEFIGCESDVRLNLPVVSNSLCIYSHFYECERFRN
jgi:hypothetical protein